MFANMHNLLATTALVLLVGGCDLIGPKMQGDWEVEVVDADDCTLDLEIDQKGKDLEGEADVKCNIYFSFYGEVYNYEMDHDNVDIEGEIDGDKFEIVLEFYDDFYEDDIEVVLTGEVDGEDIEGEVEVDGDELGDFEGSRD